MGHKNKGRVLINHEEIVAHYLGKKVSYTSERTSMLSIGIVVGVENLQGVNLITIQGRGGKLELCKPDKGKVRVLKI